MRKKSNNNHEKFSIIEKISNALDLPEEVLKGMPELEIFGNKEAVIDHCESVLEYNDKLVRIQAGKTVLKFVGRNLRLNYMTEDSIMVTGYFTMLEFH